MRILIFLTFSWLFNVCASFCNYNSFQNGDSPSWMTNQSAEAVRIQTQMGDYLQFAPLVIAFGFIAYYQDSNIFHVAKGDKKMKDLLNNKKQAYKDDGLVQLGLTTGASLGTMAILKIAVGRPRPAQYDRGETTGHSFPSGHTTMAFAPSFFVAMRYGWLKAIPSLVISTFVAYSRVVARAHYVTDVVTAAAISFLYSWLFVFKYEYKGINVELTPPVGSQYGLGVRVYW